METTVDTRSAIKRSFIISRRGNAFIPIRTEDVLLIVHQSGLNFVVDKSSNKYVVDKTLSEFELILDEECFFRANRQVIVNIHFIKEFKSLEYGKILIELKNSGWIKNEIVVSQANAGRFRSWVDNL